jgi:hypothetical protein
VEGSREVTLNFFFAVTPFSKNSRKESGVEGSREVTLNFFFAVTPFSETNPQRIK